MFEASRDLAVIIINIVKRRQKSALYRLLYRKCAGTKHLGWRSVWRTPVLIIIIPEAFGRVWVPADKFYEQRLPIKTKELPHETLSIELRHCIESSKQQMLFKDIRKKPTWNGKIIFTPPYNETNDLLCYPSFLVCLRDMNSTESNNRKKVLGIWCYRRFPDLQTSHYWLSGLQSGTEWPWFIRSRQNSGPRNCK